MYNLEGGIKFDFFNYSFRINLLTVKKFYEKSSILFLIILLVISELGYYFFWRKTKRKSS